MIRKTALAILAASIFLTACAAPASGPNIENAQGTQENSTDFEESGNAETDIAVEEFPTFSHDAEDLPELEEAEQPLTESEEIEFQGEPPVASVDWSKEETDNGAPIGRLIIPDAGVDALITFDESSDVSAVQMDPGNTEDFTDPNTVLYGINDSLHGMNAYLDEDYFKAHPYIYIYTPQRTLEYRVFAAYPGGASKILYDYNGYEFSEFCMLIEDIYHYRSMGLITDESIKEGVMEAWQMLTVSTGSRTGAEETVIYASLCGSKNNQ